MDIKKPPIILNSLECYSHTNTTRKFCFCISNKMIQLFYSWLSTSSKNKKNILIIKTHTHTECVLHDKQLFLLTNCLPDLNLPVPLLRANISFFQTMKQNILILVDLVICIFRFLACIFFIWYFKKVFMHKNKVSDKKKRGFGSIQAWLESCLCILKLFIL